MPTMWIINKALAQGIVCERKNHHVDWVVFVEWTIKDQLQRINLFEIGQARTEKGGVEEKDVELKDNAMPSLLKVVY